VLLRTLAHRRQAGARRQQPGADTLGKPVGELFGQRLTGGLHQHLRSRYAHGAFSVSTPATTQITN